MSGVRTRDTAAELAIRRELHRRGLRYRVSTPISGMGRIKPDIVFTRQKVAVFVDGCFWHRCPEHATEPKTNAEWWDQKLTKNVERDRRNDMTLRNGSWTVIRIWEHEDPVTAAERIKISLSRKLVG
jgi:DNA mismatch endonuclease (patch repair protein)